MKQEIRLEGFGRYLHLRVGKDKFLTWDLVDGVAKALKLSNSHVKRVFKQGGVDLYLDVEESHFLDEEKNLKAVITKIK